MVIEATSAHHGSVAIFYREVEHFAIEELRLHGRNGISFQLVTGRRQWHVMGCYISPRNASTVEDFAVAIRDQPYGAELLVVGNLNTSLAEPEGTPQGESIMDKLTAAGLMDTGLNFLPWRKPWLQDRCTWSMRRDVLEVQSWIYYVLGTDSRLFQDMAIRDHQHHSDHYMVLG